MNQTPEEPNSNTPDKHSSNQPSKVIAQEMQKLLKAPYFFAIPEHFDPHQRAVYQELNWLAHVLFFRFQYPQNTTHIEHLSSTVKQNETDNIDPALLQAPEPVKGSNYAALIKEHGLDDEARLLLALGLALATHLNQLLLFPLLQLAKNAYTYPLIGGELTHQQRRFQPTAKTFLYLACGADLLRQGQVQFNFQSRHPLLRSQIIQLQTFEQTTHQDREVYDEWPHKRIILQADYYNYLMGGALPLPEDNKNLPLTKLNTSLTFEDLVLTSTTREDLQPLLNYARNSQAIFNDPEFSSGFKKGFIALLYGAPGTGKTLIATTIGKKLGFVTYQLELAQTVSKYIGETSKNINQVFKELERTIDHLEGKPSILFIDEADALVGKRSEVKDSKDRYANMDVSNLLQKLEKFPGLVIMASNFQQNFDPAIKRRIDSVVFIPQPEASERTQLWQNYLPKHLQFPSPDFVKQLGEKFRLTGAQINNIMKQVVIATYDEYQSRGGFKGKQTIDFETHLEPTIKKEFIKNDEVYRRPTDFETVGNIKKDIVNQTLWWEQALPEEWQYIPHFLPSVLSRSVLLRKEEIQQLVDQTRSRWKGGAYTYLPFKDGLDHSLKTLCEEKQMDWLPIYKTIQNLISELQQEVETPSGGNASAEDNTASGSTTKNTASQKSKEYVPSEQEAPAYWLSSLPEGFEFARRDLPKNLAKFLKKNSIAEMETLLQEAAKFAQQEEVRQISFGRHISKALEVLGWKPGS